ncbi:efflux RND transporter permease subunit [Lacipirellula sp.]|uniref:efflux RND transporter permease subunit n=1 Tax=Lacipirellula sp. TaxID=2691419 RepID=UPI003D1226DD
MWIVRLALRRPYTFVVMSMLIAIMGVVTIRRMPTDIFPEIDIPVVAVIWTYSGISPEEMETRVVGNFERVLVSTVNDIEHIESQSLGGIAVIKIFLQEGASIDSSISQVVATSQQVLRSMPPGMFPPLVMRYNAANVPIVQISLDSEVLSEKELFDYATTGIRPGLATVNGAQIPYPYGGMARQIMVDIDPEKLHAWHLSAADVSEAINLQNLIAPSGTAKVGQQEYSIRLNSSPEIAAAVGDLPAKSIGNRTIYVRDVANVRDGFAPQTNVVRVNGRRGVLQPILKSGASTLEIVDGVKNKLPIVLQSLPETLRATLLTDQSIFVRHAIHGVLVEAAIAAGLTGLMILLFLGSWRSTLVIVISIPLSILVAIIALNFLGHSLNVMTLGGMALAVGILVDDATVEIENIHRNLHLGKGLVPAILDGAQQIAMPAFVATLCICIVFVPVVFITGAARSLFTPMALAVVIAMMTSYFLSRTLVPTLVHYFLASEVELYHSHPNESDKAVPQKQNIIWRCHEAFNRQFNRLRDAYGLVLAWALSHPRTVVATFAVFVALSACLAPLIGRDFFPQVDSGQIRLHVRAPAGTRIEETERYFTEANRVIRDVIPADEIEQIVDIIGIPNSGINLALSDGAMMSSADGETLITLAEHHGPTEDHVKRIRDALAERLPDLTVYFQPPDMVTQVLNFGLAAPIDVQISGPRGNYEKNYAIARDLAKRLATIPGVVDSHIQQVPLTPQIAVAADRSMMSQLGLSQRDISNDLLVALSSSIQASPNYWLDTKTGVQYPLVVQAPQRTMDSLEAIKNIPVTQGGKAAQNQLLGNLVDVNRTFGATNVTHFNIAQSFDVLASVHGSDLGSASTAIQQIVNEIRPTLPRGTSITLRGQIESMETSFSGLSYGLIFAVVLVYLLMVVNFQSWLDPLIILMALPGALSGILWMLFVTQTTISVPALMGSIMCIGVATANSILLITFANDQRKLGKSSVEAAWAAGVTRLRPVMMTALAMILGMLPMSLGMGEGGEQNAPLGRAVIGGLAMATFATLLFVPIVYSLLRRQNPERILEPELAD